MVARAWPVSVEVIQDWLLAAPRQTSHPHVSMTLLSWDIPLISFNGSLWDVLLRCSKWLLGAWLDSFTMILRCWLVVESNEPAPCLYDTVIQSYVQLKSGFKSMGQLWDVLAPQGASFTPLCGMFLQSRQPLQMWQNFTFLRNPLSELWVCEFWLLRWSTMVARGVASVCWGDSGLAACCPESNEPTLMFYDTSTWDIPLISFNGSQWDVLLRCSKWC